jgi:serine/threonine-protein kinase
VDRIALDTGGTVASARPLAPAAERPWRLIAQRVADDYELIGEISRSNDERHIAYLARAKAGDRTAVVVLQVLQATSETRVDHYALAVQATLDRGVPADDLTCPHCRASAPTWDVTCSACGASIAGDGPSAIGIPAATVYAGIRDAARPRFDILGVVAHGTESVLYAARRTDGETVALLRFRRDASGSADQGMRVTVEPVAYLRRPAPARIERPDASTTSPHSGELGPLAGVQRELLAPPVTKVTQIPALPALHRARQVCPHCGSEYDGDIKFCPADGIGLRPLNPGEDLVGRLLGDRYHILGLIGEGGMGRVYVAEHIRIGRRCAIKVLPPELMERHDAVRRFGREARNASRIGHPNVAAVYDFESGRDGLTYLAMEFVEGEPLSRLLAREGALDIPRAIAIAMQVADGMQSAHDLGIVHRDLKPDNIMIGRDRDGRDVVKIVDFGIAKALIAEADEQVTRTGFVVGTPRYMSPEQLSGGAVDARTDVYSLGCVLFEMLTGVGPTGDASKESLIRRRILEPPPRPSALRADLSDALDDLVVRALARDPADRMHTAAEMRRALDAVSSAAASAPAPGRRRMRRRVLWGAAAIASVLAVLMWPRHIVAPPTSAPTVSLAPVVVEPIVIQPPTSPERPTPPAPPASTLRDAPADAMDAAERDVRLGRYFIAKDPPDFRQAIRAMRRASGLLDGLVARDPRSTAIAERLRTVDSLLSESRRECAELHETRCE